MRAVLALAAGLALLAGPVLAAPAPAPAAAAAEAAPQVDVDELTVTASKRTEAQIVGGLVKSYAAPSPIGQLARWHDRICPETQGLEARLNDYVSQRLRIAALKVGAPLSAEPKCDANVIIFFSSDPQVVLDKVRAKVPQLLGFHSHSDRRRVSRVTHPIQAWYATATEDRNGTIRIDSEEPEGEVQVGASFLGKSKKSRLVSVMVVIDMTAVRGLPIGQVADYASLLALAQSEWRDDCKELPSVTNLLKPACGEDRTAVALTESDLAYLKALYEADPSLYGGLQRSQIALRMRELLPDR